MFQSLCFVALILGAPQQAERDFAALTAGVSKVMKPGIPGFVSATSATSIPFLLSRDGKNLMPVASAGRLGAGRVAAFGHGGYFSVANQGTDTGKLMSNVIQWCSGRASKPRVGYFEGSKERDLISGLGFEGVPVYKDTLDRDLKRVDVLIMQANFESPDLETFVRRGGGLITGHTPWGWKQLNPNDLITYMPMQSLLHKAGLSFSDGYSDQIVMPKSLEEAMRCNAWLALQHLASDGEQASPVVMAAVRSTADNDPLQGAVRDLAKKTPPKIPTAQSPILSKDGVGRMAIMLSHLNVYAYGVQLKASPSASDFPGSVPADAARVTEKVTVPVDKEQWVSTGYYAAPGEAVWMTIPDALSQRVSIQIGCHEDTLWHLDSWQRDPEIVTRLPIKGHTIKLWSPFGGLIYLVVDRPTSLPPQEIVVGGAVRSARFELGKTSLAEWKEQLKNPAPWAEIGSGKLIFSVPIEDARKVQDPIALMKLWDKTIDLYSDLDGSPVFDRPERIVCDRQISAGYMHSGYPIMTWMDKSISLSLNTAELTSNGTWGHWHELGHNRQKGEWTFDGTGEVTNNIFTVYMMCKIAGKPLFDRIGAEKPKVEAYLAKGGDFAQWKREPFLALYMYMLLVKDFGWDSMKAYFRSYSSGPQPKNDLEKHDQFMVRYSKVVNRNLGPYFQAWGVPTSESARDSIKTLPSWMPKELPGK